MLVVSLGVDSVSMEMRAGGDGVARRRVQPAVQGESNLRVVAWLAGNLARDQTREIMDARPPTRMPSARAVALSEAAEESRPVESRASTQPPALAPAEAPTVARQAPPVSEAVNGEGSWRVGLAIGKTMFFEFGDHYINRGFFPATTSRVEILAPSGAGAWSWSGSLDVSKADQYFSGQGYMLSLGRRRRFPLTSRWWAADVSWGGGLSIYRGLMGLPVAGSSPPTYTSSYETIGPNLAAQASGALVVTGWRFGELVISARLDEFSDHWRQPELILTGGLRINL
jgi:hypothetical protein